MARASSAISERGLLEAALTGLELQRQKIDEQIQTVRSRLGSAAKRRGRSVGAKAKTVVKAVKSPNSKRVLSEAARKRIAAAQKRRWAAYRKASGPKASE